MKNIITNIKKYKYIYVLALPSTIYVLVFKIIPLYGLQIAFKDFNFREGITRSELVGFKNFITLFSKGEFWQALENTKPVHKRRTHRTGNNANHDSSDNIRRVMYIQIHS